MKRLAILIVLMLVVAGAAGAGWWFLLREDPAQEVAGSEAELDGDVPAKRFVEIEPMVLPILREGRVTLHMTFILVVELDRPMRVDRIHNVSLRLRDSLFSELHGIFAFRHVQDRGHELPIVRERLAVAAERALGAGTVKSVLIKSVSQRVPNTS
ncbi:MAG: hypothetical protein ACE5GS_07525 [Kiloniellaceae bacterium]